MAGRNYMDLVAWQKAMDLVELIYEATTAFPREERFGLTNQLRRASVSIPSNIAEGQGRYSPRDFHRFLSMAYGSLREVETQVCIAGRLHYLDRTTSVAILENCAEVGRLINGLASSISRRETDG